MASLDNLLYKIYYTPSNQGSFCGAANLWRAVKESGFEKVPFETIKKWLEKQDTYTLHAPARKRFVRNRVEVRGVDEIWEADLVDAVKPPRGDRARSNDAVLFDVFHCVRCTKLCVRATLSV